MKNTTFFYSPRVVQEFGAQAFTVTLSDGRKIMYTSMIAHDTSECTKTLTNGLCNNSGITVVDTVPTTSISELPKPHYN